MIIFVIVLLAAIRDDNRACRRKYNPLFARYSLSLFNFMWLVLNVEALNGIENSSRIRILKQMSDTAWF